MGRIRAACLRLPTPLPSVGRPRAGSHQEPAREDWRRRYPLFPRLLFVLDGTGPAGIDNRIRALRAAARDLVPPRFVQQVPILAAPLTDLLRNGPSAPVWRPVQDPEQRLSWMDHSRPPAAPARPTAPEPDRSWPPTAWGTPNN